MLVWGALVNALAFSGSNYLFTILRSSGVDEERKCHDKAVEQLQAVDAAMQEYAQVSGRNLDPLGPEPQLSDFYHPSGGQRDREITFVILGMAPTGFVAYWLAKRWGAF